MGFAHLGVLAALEKRGYRPQAIAGTSMGAFVGALFAYPASKPQIDVGMLDFFAAVLTRGWTFRARLRRIFGEATIGDCAMPFIACVSTPEDPFSPVYLSDPALPLWQVVAASCSLPFAFSPTKIGSTWYADGGCADNMPAAALRSFGRPVIGVEVGFLDCSYRDDDNPSGWSERRKARLVARYRDVGDALILPQLRSFTPQSFGNTPAIITAGYDAVDNLLSDQPDKVIA